MCVCAYLMRDCSVGGLYVWVFMCMCVFPKCSGHVNFSLWCSFGNSTIQMCVCVCVGGALPGFITVFFMSAQSNVNRHSVINLSRRAILSIQVSITSTTHTRTAQVTKWQKDKSKKEIDMAQTHTKQYVNVYTHTKNTCTISSVIQQPHSLYFLVATKI